MTLRSIIGTLLVAAPIATMAQNNPGSNHGNRFEQLGTMLSDPNIYRSASGIPGPKYWQQRADYDISAELDEAQRRLIGSETITYYNNSPTRSPTSGCSSMKTSTTRSLITTASTAAP